MGIRSEAAGVLPVHLSWSSRLAHIDAGRTGRLVAVAASAVVVTTAGAVLASDHDANVTPGLTTDNVDANDAAFLITFPYFAPGN